MPLFRRTPEAAASIETLEPSPAPKTGGKGRPTPKRREAEKRRRRAVTPTDRKEAYKLRRKENREERRRMRQALATGDERHLPPRDSGPGRRYTRDVVDGRFNIGSMFLPAALLLLLASAVPAVAQYLTIVYLGLIAGVVVDGVLLTRRVKREVSARYGVKEAQGVGMYAVMRGLQIRRLRMPPPKVKRGEPPRS